MAFRLIVDNITNKCYVKVLGDVSVTDVLLSFGDPTQKFTLECHDPRKCSGHSRPKFFEDALSWKGADQLPLRLKICWRASTVDRRRRA
ncbi:GL16605 [Drosophila persimilis]|uniref:GL16605 n=1 Tax=Drosophila persimilis TaxID=7234 RepID=B4GQT0_DROPE|nr:GL16605 [Drosophila persimilis]